MRRDAETDLNVWLKDADRKPLVLRGARQVGKTWLVRNLALQHGKDLIEFNFERDPTGTRFFVSNDPKDIIAEISLGLNRPIHPENALLFLDEIQAAAELLAKLRWFAEEMPQLAVIAAGSLLEFALDDHAFSMPVGRVGFLHIEPISFLEFLDAHGQTLLRDRLLTWRPGMAFSPVAHEQALLWFDRYAMVGGFPAVVAKDVAGHEPRQCRDAQLDIIATYRADFARHSKFCPPAVLEATMRAAARSLGRKFVYAHVDEGVKQNQARQAVELLARARVCHLVNYTAANGLPLGGETKPTFRKVILNDAGMFHALIMTPAGAAFPKWESLSPQVRGQLAEQLAGQQLRLLGPLRGDGPELYYWQRDGGRPGEIDYLVQHGGRILPIELKSGTAGAMKSLHQFMFDKKLDWALRFDRNMPSDIDLEITTTQGDPVRYHLRSLPWYYAGMLKELAG
jgi:hypothetical protein